MAIPVVKIEVAIVAPAFVYIPLWIGMSRKFFADEELDVGVHLAGGATHDVTQRISHGSSQIGIGTPEGVLLDTTGRLVIVAGHANRAALSLVAQPRFKRIEDLRGASLGVASLTEGTAYILRDILEQHGLSAVDYDLVEVGTHPVRWNALKAGTLDAALQLVPFDFMAADAGFSVLGRAADYVPAYAFTTVNVQRTFALANERVLEAFLRALSRATSYVYDHAATIAGEASTASGIPLAYAERAIQVLVEQHVIARDLTLEERALATVSQMLRRAGTPQLCASTDAVDLRWLDRSRSATYTI